MKLKHILEGLPVKDLQNDSRKVTPGDVFLAYAGYAADGRDYIQHAVKAGAEAILYEPGVKAEVLSDIQIPAFAYPNLAKQLGALAAEFYPLPKQGLRLSGVTGTNGKTTIAYQLAMAHDLLGQKTAYMGTLGVGLPSAMQPLNNTTPDALCIQKVLKGLVAENISHLAMEVSSHGLAEGRVSQLRFTQAIYTNLSHEHLDYHKTFEAYARAKARLFAYPSLQSVILNLDDAHVDIMRAAVPQSTAILTYGLTPHADVYAKNIELNMTGSQFDVVTPKGIFSCEVEALGHFNVYNSLAVIASLMAEGYALDDIAAIMPKLKASPGRMERVLAEPVVLVDYAHTPDALEKALSTLADLKKSKLFVVFGCGGDRDTSKRALMGKVAEQYADKVIVTSDNPRTECPTQIIDHILEGLSAGLDVCVIEDRRAAIHEALKLAKPDDMILIAGKGHEDYQEIAGARHPFLDADVVRSAPNTN